MLFNSLTFLVFFAVVFPVYLLLRGWGARKTFLLLASYVFYAAWNPAYVFILAFSTGLDWWLARRLGREEAPGRRKLLLVVSLVANLGLLGFFKYGDFALHNMQALLGLVGVAYAPPAWDIVLPVGISFYTFASLSYTIDVYRREIRGDASLRDYALFVAFFPHLVAGPIVRARALLPQLATPRLITPDQVAYGLVLVLIGLFCKDVFADRLFAPVVDAVYAAPGSAGTVAALAAFFGFAGQIYFDFGGYSLCAIGLAMVFGFAFPDNFHFPYGARGLSDFWRRWHMSLSTWLRDYLYIPLGGNRGGEWRTCRNLMLTMLLGGLWHGASWTFVVWGGLHGLYLIAERVLRRHAPPIGGILGDVLVTTTTFILVCVAWVAFRAPSFGSALEMFGAMGRWEVGTPVQWLALMAALGMFGWHWRMRDRTLDDLLAASSEGARAAVAAVCIIGIFLAAGGDQRAFIYFQF
ncbi:D-alanyl-lipoteichoic acid acyltransferase DltB, MBOAT superfamily [Luteibacter sp. UNCMF331Sha3.1]|uniref:MBOAT family O-acyltransferase n=1 Tax=Luteibacter sp. UNCMF331Sha3.1 TaxID=1502760 RepID=UPI0008AC0EC6|nr:MBOAT family O-acyltransferase [Luteibacter sp. UNCMF331Sha3.1]SEM92311.1 D-alanyl-lipoteichoic acid acyltransferase DltB, MBOAT superfamily [Luteibacter sp. UNCMF331Sha3.1]